VSAGPLRAINIGEDLGCQVAHSGDASLEFFPPQQALGDCGTFLRAGPVLYAPDFYAHGITATGALGTYAPFVPAGQSAVSGSGTLADPYRVVTDVDAGTLHLRQTDSYVVGQETYRTDVAVTNNAPGTAVFSLYRAGDCYLGDDDFGFALRTDATKMVACAKSPNNTPPQRLLQWDPVTPPDHSQEAFYIDLWSILGGHQDLADTCVCSSRHDNAAGLEWNLTLGPGASRTVSHVTTFSPAGVQPVTMGKTADTSRVLPGAQDGYTISVSNSNNFAVTLNNVVDTLPSGFAYVPGTTTGAISTDPAINGQQLVFAGFTVPALGSASLHFAVTTSSVDGTYFNSASADAGSVSVVPADNTAPIIVGSPPPPPPPFVVKYADQPYAQPSADDGYTIFVYNPATQPLTLASIADDLPTGFTYLGGSTTGVTAANPVGPVGLFWEGPFVVPAQGVIALHFDVEVAAASGTYYNQAYADGIEALVMPTGSTAPITVPPPLPGPTPPTPPAPPPTPTPKGGSGGVLDTDGDGMPDWYEYLHPCLNPLVPDANADPDHDGVTNIQEYLAGTDPCSAPGQLTFVVNSPLDPGPAGCTVEVCTLRAAIATSNAHPGLDTITFAIPGAYRSKIDLASALPAISDPVNITGVLGSFGAPRVELFGGDAGLGIDGLAVTAGGTTIFGLMIDGFNGNGITLTDLGGNNVAANFLIGNAGNGVAVLAGSSANVVGGTAAGTGNFIRSNGIDGVEVSGVGAVGNAIEGNTITGNATDGVRFDAGASANTVGGTVAAAANVITSNGDLGVAVAGATGDGILGNSISANTAGGIALMTGGNAGQPAPVVSRVSSDGGTTSIQGTFAGAPNTTYRLEWFANAACDGSGFGQGKTFLGAGTLTTGGSGTAAFTQIVNMSAQIGQAVTGTATDGSNNTSQFSACASVAARSCPGDTDCDGYSDAQEVAIGHDPFIYCAIMRADVDGDGLISILDLSRVARYFGQYVPPAPARYDQGPPFDHQISILDLSAMARQFGKNISVCP
jgi:uncharacterized repeat protein (TIGR01451 family)